MISLEAPALSPEATAIVQQTLDDLQAQFDVVRSESRIGPRVVTLHYPRDADDLIDEAAFAIDERLPYWADVGRLPGARGTAAHDPRGRPPVVSRWAAARDSCRWLPQSPGSTSQQRTTMTRRSASPR